MSVGRLTPAVARKSYISLGNFVNDIFTYSYTFDLVLRKEVGKLIPFPQGNECPPGRVLHENGRRLNPSDGMFNGANDGVLTYMVGVYDPISLLSGFISPNSPNFSVYSPDKPIYLTATSPDPNPRYSTITTPSNGLLTNAPILSIANFPSGVPNYVGVACSSDYLDIGGANIGVFEGPYALAINEGLGSNIFALATGEGGDYQTSNWAGMYSDGNVYFSNSLNVRNNKAAGTVTLPASNPNRIILNNTCDLSEASIVFLTRKTNGSGALGNLSYTLSLPSTLTISSSDITDNSQVNFLIVNLDA